MMSKTVAGAARADAKRSGAETEYKEVCNNLRFYGDLRFKQLTIYLALNAALLTWLGKQEMEGAEKFVAAMAGIFSSFLFGIIERSSNRYWDSFCERASELEGRLQMKQYRSLQRGTSLLDSAVRATYAIYWSIALTWLLFLAWPVAAAWRISLPSSAEAAWLFLVPWAIAAVWLLSRVKWTS